MLDDPVYWALVALGLLLNLGLALKEASDAAGVRVWPRQYIAEHPYDVALGALGGIAAGIWIAPDVEAVKMGLVAGMAGTAFLERLSRMATKRAG